MGSVTPLFLVPHEIIVYLSLFLPQKFVLHLGQTCRRLAKILFHEDVYRQRLRKEYPRYRTETDSCYQRPHRLQYQRLSLIHSLSLDGENFVQPIDPLKQFGRICLIYPLPPFEVKRLSRCHRIVPDIQIWSETNNLRRYYVSRNRITCCNGPLPELIEEWDSDYYPYCFQVTLISAEEVVALLKQAAEVGYCEAPSFDGMCSTAIPDAWVQKYPTCFVFKST